MATKTCLDVLVTYGSSPSFDGPLIFTLYKTPIFYALLIKKLSPGQGSVPSLMFGDFHSFITDFGYFFDDTYIHENC